MTMHTIIAFIPVALVIVLLVIFNRPAKHVMMIVWLVCAALSAFIWKMDLASIAAFSIYGGLKGFDILVTIFGAILLLNTLHGSGAMHSINRSLSVISPDRRIQAILIGWMFNSFIEGAAGFGTPAALTAPLLVGLGFPPMAAAMFALICNSTAVAFGVVGVPTMTALSEVRKLVELAGMNIETFNAAVVRLVALLHMSAGMFIPLIALAMLTKFFGREKSIKPALSAAPYAIFSGLSFVVPSVLLAFLFGPEFPSLVGSLIGMVVLIFATKRGFLVPKTVWDFTQATPAPYEETNRSESRREDGTRRMSGIKAWLPYILITVVLVITRLPALGLTPVVKGLKLVFGNILGIGGATYEFLWAWLPGTVFIIVSLLTIRLHKIPGKTAVKVWKDTFRQVANAAITLVFGVALVQLMLNSNVNALNLPSMMTVMAESITSLFGKLYLIVSPFIGVLGAFISGSNTVSNMLFVSMQFESARLLGFSPVLVVALQCVGGGIGNMICINNIVAACSTVGIKNAEGALVRRNIVPLLIYCVIVLLVSGLIVVTGINLLALAG